MGAEEETIESAGNRPGNFSRLDEVHRLVAERKEAERKVIYEHLRDWVRGIFFDLPDKPNTESRQGPTLEIPDPRDGVDSTLPIDVSGTDYSYSGGPRSISLSIDADVGEPALRLGGLFMHGGVRVPDAGPEEQVDPVESSRVTSWLCGTERQIPLEDFMTDPEAQMLVKIIESYHAALKQDT